MSVACPPASSCQDPEHTQTQTDRETYRQVDAGVDAAAQKRVQSWGKGTNDAPKRQACRGHGYPWIFRRISMEKSWIRMLI